MHNREDTTPATDCLPLGNPRPIIYPERFANGPSITPYTPSLPDSS